LLDKRSSIDDFEEHASKWDSLIDEIYEALQNMKEFGRL